MHQPDSQKPYSPYGQGQYPQAPQYQPYMPYQPYQQPPPPRKGMSTSKIIAIIVVVVVLVIVLPFILAGVLMVYLQGMSQSGGNVEAPLAMAIDDYFPANTTNGTNWVLEIVSGSRPAAGVDIQVIDPNTGARTVDKPLKGFSDLDGQYRDTTGNGKLDKFDTIWLSGQGGHVKNGCRVQLMAGGMIVAGPVTLP